MKINEVSYQELINIRRDKRLEGFIPPIMSYKQLDSGYYIISIEDNGAVYEAEVLDEQDVQDFETNRKQFCHKVDKPIGKLIKTHDFSDNSTWQNGQDSTKSIYAILPDPGKEFKIIKLKGKVDKNIAFAQGQSFVLNIWEGITAACPAFSSDKTPFGTPLYDPQNQVYTGWYKAYPSGLDVQEVEVWVYFESNIPKYKVTNFKFKSIDDFKDKGDFVESSSSLRINYEYINYGIYLTLRSSMNERMEMYTSDDNEITRPAGSIIKSSIAAVVSEYDEW